MSTVSPAVTLPAVTVSPEVYAYCSKHGLETPLERLLKATPRIFPLARSIQVFMEQDIEDSELWLIVFEVVVRIADYPDCLAAEKPWFEEWQRAYPTPRQHFFVLSLRRRPT